MGLFGLILCAIVLADITLAIGSKLHYSLDVIAAVPLSFLVYGNPALALMAQDWADPVAVEVKKDPTGAPRFPPDLGFVSVAPCCLPFADVAGTYYLQDRDWDFSPYSWTAERQRQHYRRKSEIQAMLEATRRRCEDLTLLLQSGKRAAEHVLEERRKEVDRRVAEVCSIQERELADAKSALEADREVLAALKSKLASTSAPHE